MPLETHSRFTKDKYPTEVFVEWHQATSTRKPESYHHPNRPKLSKSQGSVLIAVLAIIVLLSFMVTRFIDEAISDLEYRSIFNEPIDVRTFAYSMLEVSLATIQEVALIDDGKLYAAEQGWKNPIKYSGITVPQGWDVRVEINDEGGRLSLNTMTEEQLNNLLEETLQFDFGTTRELSSSLLDWIDSDESRRLNGAESEDYLDEDPPYRAANGPLQSIEELRLINVWKDEFFDEEGRPNELFEQLSNLVSVIYAGPVNLNTASDEVIETLAEAGGWQDDFLFDGIDEPYLKTVPDTVADSAVSTEVTLLRVNVSVRRGDVPFMISALVEPNFSAVGDASGGAPGRDAERSAKTGSAEEQDAIAYPFKILQLTEYESGNQPTTPARYSEVDIQTESNSNN
ncbi:MAG: hypothetical protein AAF546_02225 [Verrucomicrobiota bacterium]